MTTMTTTYYYASFQLRKFAPHENQSVDCALSLVCPRLARLTGSRIQFSPSAFAEARFVAQLLSVLQWDQILLPTAPSPRRPDNCPPGSPKFAPYRERHRRQESPRRLRAAV